MPKTISESKGRTRHYLSHLGVPVTHLEQMFVEYYAAIYGRTLAEVVRGMIRTYVETDDGFDAPSFVKWVENDFISRQSDPENRRLCKQALKKYLEKTK